MTGRTLKVIAVAAVTLMGVTVSIADTAESPTTEPTQILTKLFEALKTKGASDALKVIEPWFQPSESSGNLLALKMDELQSSFGVLEGYEFVGERSLGSNVTYVEFAFVSYHRLGPALWEGAAYRRKDGWTILRLKFSTEELFEKARSYSRSPD